MSFGIARKANLHNVRYNFSNPKDFLRLVSVRHARSEFYQRTRSDGSGSDNGRRVYIYGAA